MARSTLRIGAAALLLVCGSATFIAGGCGLDRESPAPARGLVNYDKHGNLLASPTAKAGRPSLIVILIDTLRSDAVGLPDGLPGHMPFVSSLARRGVSFSDATAPAPWTVPSVISLLTGLMPSEHGCNEMTAQHHLSSGVTTYAEALRAGHGYDTRAWTARRWFQLRSSLLAGFRRAQGVSFHLQGTRDLLEGWVRTRDSERPFFLLLHTFEAHDPYGAANHPWPPFDPRPGVKLSDLDPARVTEPWRMAESFLLSRNERVDLFAHHKTRLRLDVIKYLASGYAADPRPELAARLRRAYYDGVRWVDGLVADTVAQLQTWGLLENTLLVITSDHGEAFGEHGTLEHGRQLYDELIHIPLVMVGPPPFQGGRVIGGGVGLIDIMPTFFDFAGLAPVRGTAGRSFMGRVRAEDETAGWPVPSEELLNYENTSEQGKDVLLRSVRSKRWKYIVSYDRTTGHAREEAYDLSVDPGEVNDLLRDGGSSDSPAFDSAFRKAVEEVRGRVAEAVGATHGNLTDGSYGTR